MPKKLAADSIVSESNQRTTKTNSKTSKKFHYKNNYSESYHNCQTPQDKTLEQLNTAIFEGNLADCLDILEGSGYKDQQTALFWISFIQGGQDNV